MIISKEKAVELIADGAVMLDVRTPSEYQQHHIPNAVNIPVTELETCVLNHYIEPSGVYIVYCRTGGRASAAVLRLNDLGINNVFTLGAMSNWMIS